MYITPAAIIYMIIIFLFGMLVPMAWYIAFPAMIAFYFISPFAINKIDYVIWRFKTWK